MGTDLLESLGIDLLFSKKLVTWDNLQIPMKNRGTITDWDVTENIYEAMQEPLILRMSEDRHNEIIKQMYAKIDIDEHVKTVKHLSSKEQVKLGCVLSMYSDMYKDTVGTLNTPPAHFELKPDAKPYHARLFPIPKGCKNLTEEECGRFEKDTIWHHTLDSE